MTLLRSFAKTHLSPSVGRERKLKAQATLR